jgi:secreted PhoX family phosphatase
MEPTSLPDAPPTEASGATRRTFIQGIAAAGASTAAAVALDRAGLLDVATAEAAAPGSFAEFTAIAPSAADALQVPEGYRADVLIGWGDTFLDGDENELEFGFNCDFLAYFPLKGSDEGLLFVNHEYPSPYFQHGVTSAANKTPAQIDLERAAVGYSIVHVKRDTNGLFQIVSPSPYNRRIDAMSTPLTFTGPLAGLPGIGPDAPGSLANCSGGITPWGTALSCEENYQDYVGTYGWSEAKTGTKDYINGDGSTPDSPAKFGWVCEHDPHDPSFVGHKHTGLGRFRHENTAFRAQPNQKFVLYMGDDRNDGGVYKFVSELPYRPGRRTENLDILTKGKLYIARWEPGGRRTFELDGTLASAEEGTGYWREVAENELVDTHARIMTAVTSDEWLAHYATNRPEDVEVAEDGTVWIALTNNANVNDVHGSIRTLREFENDPGAAGPGEPFEWVDYAPGGPDGAGFSSPDNLVFDKAENVWVVTDISSSSLNDPTKPQAFHANNAVFLVPKGQPDGEVKAFRFANMPVHAEGTGPYFTPDEKTLFVNVQHPGEESKGDPAVVDNYTSYWPKGNKTTGQNPGKPIPSTVQITKVPKKGDPGTPVIPPPPPGAPGPTPPDTAKPDVDLASSQLRKLSQLRGKGVRFAFEVDEASSLTVTLSARLRKAGKKAKGRGKSRRLARGTVRATRAGEVAVRLRPSAALRLLLKREREVPATLKVVAVDAAGNRTTRTIKLLFR